jgi:D-alanyl-lipoteichoic acid acyltransferase DltB (MBOAT superfamily)
MICGGWGIMLFNSREFIFIFLPLSVVGYLLLGRLNWRRGQIAWLVFCSFFYYGWRELRFVPLLAGAILVNFAAGWLLVTRVNPVLRRTILVCGLVFNLGLLVYFKYTNFFLQSFNELAGSHWGMLDIVLPLGISFFTFQKIAYLVDCYRGKAEAYNLLDFGLFVMFFPQLIAGPIVHHAELVPQFATRRWHRVFLRDIAVGGTIFLIGLFKKVALADAIAPHASAVFGAAAAGQSVGFADAWLGALAYTLQIYFDFSAYSDMAIGIARLFGIWLPLNFDSPYKSLNIIEFWRRWHITLSRFLRDYLYIPLGGNRKGKFRRYINLMVTMLLGGLWHGAAWTFIAWGFLHGVYLVVNHAWRHLRGAGPDRSTGVKVGFSIFRLGAGALTFVAVVGAWVFFRADTFHAAKIVLLGMADVTSLAGPMVFEENNRLLWVGGLLAAVFLLPNTQELMSHYKPALEYLRRFSPSVARIRRPGAFVWRPTPIWAAVIAAMSLAAFTQLSRVSEFIYYRF